MLALVVLIGSLVPLLVLAFFAHRFIRRQFNLVDGAGAAPAGSTQLTGNFKHSVDGPGGRLDYLFDFGSMVLTQVESDGQPRMYALRREDAAHWERCGTEQRPGDGSASSDGAGFLPLNILGLEVGRVEAAYQRYLGRPAAR